MKKFLLILFLFFVFLLFAGNKISAQQPLELNFFYSVTCPHCKNEGIFLDQIEKKYSGIKINRYEISEYSSLLADFYKKFQVPIINQGRVPITFINDWYIVGFNETIGQQIENYVVESTNQQPINQPVDEDKITLPFVGRIDPTKFTLPVLAIILGFLDGFNVCSLGALLIILTLVLSLRSRKKILIFGSSYIITTAFVYGLLIFFWYQLFNFLTPYIRIMETVIGLITAIGAFYFFKEFLKAYKYGPNCEIDEGKKISGRFSVRFQKMIEENKKLLPIVFSILLFAATITIVEFPCSAAVPLVFAGILSQAQLPNLLYILYICIYIFFYLIDELIIFFIAVFSMKLWLSSPKFVTWIILIQALIMTFLSFHYLFGLL